MTLRQSGLLYLCAFLFCVGPMGAQYTFDHTEELECTPVKNQAKTGTCWSFATASFIESELMRMGKGRHDLSEMFVVRNIYEDKARNYILRQGKANFSQGSLAHDLIRMIAKEGVVPEGVYSGLMRDEKAHDHSEMEAGLKGFLDGILETKTLSPKWKDAFDGILDAYIGDYPDEFVYQGKTYTPKSLAASLGIDPDDYVSITSFTHHPYGEQFILEVPDNYSNGSFQNVPLDQMVAVVDKALDMGYTVAWDGDVSEKGFSAGKGIAVLPTNPKREDLFESPGPEMTVDAEKRQMQFESFQTTDDHLMHIVGKATDQNGTEYYIVKNSWGEVSPFEGFLYMSKPYFKMKTVFVMVHENVM